MDPTHFRLLKISLIRGVGCPKELQASIDNSDRRMAIIVVGNEEAYGTSTYIPPAVVVAGAQRRAQLLAAGFPKSWAWVHKDLEIQADDEIGSNELMQKLASLLNIRVCGRESCILGQASPYIVELYPFENYVVYDLKGQKYRQPYMLDPVERKVALNGPSTAVDEKFVNAGETKEIMPRVQTGVRYAFAPSVANTQSTNRGALNSELMTQLVRNMSNILQSAQAYLDAIKSGLHHPMQPAFYPVDISNNKVQQVLKANKIDYFDFCRWAAAEQHKKYQTRGGKKIPKSKFAYAPGDDPSKWKLPVDTPGRAKDALARVNQTEGVPSGAKSAVMNKIRRAATHHGINVADKTSGKQKKWLKAQPLSTL